MIFDINLSEAFNIIKPLAQFILAMVIYSLFVFKFYRFLAKRDVFTLDLDKYNNVKHHTLEKIFAFILYFLKYIILLPVMIFFWFGVLSVLLSVLAKNQTLQDILLISMAVVGTVRILSYYNEDLSKDLAKMLPFALLGVFLIDNTFLLVNQSLDLIKQIPNELSVLLYYLIFIAVMELILRILGFIFGFTKKKNKVESDE